MSRTRLNPLEQLLAAWFHKMLILVHRNNTSAPDLGNKANDVYCVVCADNLCVTS